MNQNTIQFAKFGYSGIFTELDQIAKDKSNFVHISMCDPPRFGFTLDQTVWNKIDKLKLSTFTEYPNWNGQIDLLKALSHRIQKWCEVDIPPNNILMTNGVSEGFPLTFDSIFHQKKGSIAIPDPSYIPILIQAPRFSKAWFYHCDETNKWNPDVDHLKSNIEKHPDTKAIMVITPNAPTGAVYSEKVLKEIVNIAGQYDLIIVTDEIYDALSFTKYQSPLKYASEVPMMYMNGFSKVYRLPGYRLGYLGWYDPEEKHPEVWQYLERISKSRFGVSRIAQEIAKLALNEPPKVIETYKKAVLKKQIFLNNHFKEIPELTVVPSEGGTYVYPKITTNDNDNDLVKRLLRDHGVYVCPGSAYGPTIAPGHLRFVTLAPEEDLLLGVNAMKLVFKEIH